MTPQPLADLGGDLRYAGRGLRRAPGFALAVILTLALGIGVSTAIFSAVNAVLLRPLLPSGHPEQLAYIWTPNRGVAEAPVDSFGPSYADFFDLQRQLRSFSALTLFDQVSVSWAGGGTAARIGGAHIRSNFFSTLGIAPELGRGIEAGDVAPGGAPVVVISHGLWCAAFNASRQALGQTLTLDGRSYRVVGVMPPDFTFPTSSEVPGGASGILANDVWLPLVLTPQQRANRDFSSGNVLGRLGSGATVAQAQAELNAVMPRLDALHSLMHGWYGAVRALTDTAEGGSRRLLWMLFAAAALLLLIACANVANLFLVRAAGRTREMGIRAALGAGRGRILRQRLAEALLLAALDGSLGIGIAAAALRLLLRWNPGGIPRLETATLDLRALLFAMAIAFAAAATFATLPELGAARAHLAEVLKQGGRGAVGAPRRWRSGLVVAEIALAALLLAASGLVVRSYENLESVPAGFSHATLTMDLALDARYSRMAPAHALVRRVLDRLGALPGVTAAAAAADLPLSHATTVTALQIEGDPHSQKFVESHQVTERYFEAMGIPLLAGRAFTGADAGALTDVIVDETFAQAYFPGQSALGRRICLCSNAGAAGNWLRIVGVVAHARHHRLDEAPPAQVYEPYWVFGTGGADHVYFALRTSAPLRRMAPALRAAVRGIDPDLAIAGISTMGRRVADAGAGRKFQAALFAAFALAALLLAAVGLYGVMAYAVRQRTAEIGIRMALGARRGQVLQLVVGQGMALAISGIVLGMLAACGLARWLSSLLFGIAPTDAANLAVAAAVLAAVSLAACAVPAHRASRVDPREALREE